jgi:hypothetical protein
MQTDVYELHGQRILDLPAEGPLLRTGQDANDLIGEAKAAGAASCRSPDHPPRSSIF